MATIRADRENLQRTTPASDGDSRTIAPELGRVRGEVDTAAAAPAPRGLANIVDGLATVGPADALACHAIALGWAVTITGPDDQRTITLTFQEPSLPTLLLTPELRGLFQIVAAFLALMLIALATTLSVRSDNEPARS
jgi:hypothetical protein